jgi:pre-mRNA-processing factor 39
LRYGQWLTKVNLLDEAKSAYERAANTFLPKEKCSARIALALILEEKEDIEQSREAYQTILHSSKFGLVDIPWKSRA